MFLSKILTRSGMITQYILEDKIFVVIVYNLLKQQTCWNVILMNAVIFMVNKTLRCQKRWARYIRKLVEEKKSLFLIYAYFESILILEKNGKQNPKESYTTNIKNMLFAVMTVN